MNRRQDPTKELSENEKEAQLEKLANWLGQEWLESKDPHPVRELWNRKDWLATIELLTIGNSLKKIEQKVSPKTLEDAALDMKSNDFGNRAGSLFEIIGSAIFDNPDHPITMPKVGQPGYDFAINLPNEKKIRVSCKALIPSAKEIEFRKFCNSLHKQYTSTLPLGSATITKMYLVDKNDSNKFNVPYILNGLSNTLAQGYSPERSMYVYGGWGFTISPLAPEEGYSFWNAERSQTFLSICPFLGDEQKRFEDKIDNAISNLKKHCSDVSSEVGNIILIKIPESISFTKAREWLKNSFDDYSDSISAILLIRSQVVSEAKKESTSCVVYEISFVENPKAKFNLKTYLDDDFQFKLEIPIGKVTDVETRLEIHDGSRILNPTEAYVYFTGHHFYHTHFSSGKAEFSARGYPNISVSTFITGLGPDPNPLRLDFIFPPENELILI
ncbi:MAG: hypothetical protein ABL930_12590 [Pseudobdellovibrio sp.]